MSISCSSNKSYTTLCIQHIINTHTHTRIMLYWHTHTNKQASKQTNKPPSNKEAKKQTNKQTNKQTTNQPTKQRKKERKKETNKQRDTQTQTHTLGKCWKLREWKGLFVLMDPGFHKRKQTKGSWTTQDSVFFLKPAGALTVPSFSTKSLNSTDLCRLNPCSSLNTPTPACIDTHSCARSVEFKLKCVFWNSLQNDPEHHARPKSSPSKPLSGGTSAAVA